MTVSASAAAGARATRVPGPGRRPAAESGQGRRPGQGQRPAAGSGQGQRPAAGPDPDPGRAPDRPGEPVLRIRQGALAYGARTVWSGLDVDVRPGEFVAVLGANGSGKTSLLRVILGEAELASGSAQILGEPIRRGNERVGYVPQRVDVDALTMIKARDLVRIGLEGHRWGLPVRGRRRVRERIDALLGAVGAAPFADAPVSMLSGGELQRVRIAEAVASDPALLLCDEPLAALDFGHQQSVVALLDAHRRASGAAVLFVTHDVNAVLGAVDRVLYLAGGRARIGTPDEVLTSASLSDLYGAPVDVFHAQGRVIVVAASDPGAGTHPADAHEATR